MPLPAYASFPQLILPTGKIQQSLYDALRMAILDGRLKAGTKLPSSRTLAEMMSISRNSVLAALERLIDEGYIYTKASSGTYVANNIPDELITTDSNLPTSSASTIADLKLNPHIIATLEHWQESRLLHNGKQMFHIGVGCVDLFPHQLWGRLLGRAWRKTYHQLGQFHDSRGYLPLRQAICQYVQSTRGLKCHENQILIVNGTQQAIHLAAHVLLQPDDSVCLDDPGYDAALGVFRCFGAKVYPVHSDGEGMKIQDIVQHYPQTKLVYTAPSHQFPLGGTLSLTRRLALLDWAAEQGKWIFEDDYNSEFRYGTRPIQALQGLAQQRVIYAGTFSKMMFPEFRLGFLVVPETLIEAFTLAKYYTDTRSSYLEQITLASFIEDGHYARHVRKIRQACYQRQQTLITAIQTNLSNYLNVQSTDSGIHLVCWLKDNIREQEFIKICQSMGLAVQLLSRYCQTPYDKAAVLFGYAAHSEEEIITQIQKLATALKG